MKANRHRPITLKLVGLGFALVMVLGPGNGGITRAASSHPATGWTILHKMQSAARKAGSAQSTTTLAATGQFQGVILNVGYRMHTDFFVRKSPLEKVRIAGSEQIGSHSLKFHGRMWVSGQHQCQFLTNHVNFNRLQGLFVGAYPMAGPPKAIKSVRYVGPSTTFGVPTWEIQVTYKWDVAKTNNRINVVSEYISRADYKLIRLVLTGPFHSRYESGTFSVRERFGHYGKPVKVTLPKHC